MKNLQKVSLKDSKVSVRPVVGEDLIKTIAAELFGLKVDEGSEMKELVSYDDCNYLIQGRLSDVRSNEEQSYGRFILKIKHSGEPDEISKLIPDLMKFCYKRCHKDFLLPKPITITNSENILTQPYEIPLSNNITVENEIDLNTIVADNLRVLDKEIFNVNHLVSLTVYVPGDILCKETLTKSLSYQIGENAARLDAVLKEYHCDSEETLRSNWIWDLAAHSDLLRSPYVSSIECHALRTKIEDILKSHDEFTLPKLKNIQKQWIHSDINEHNIIVREDKFIGFIDFGDTIYSYRVVDVATALSYISILAKDKCLIYIAEFMRGYQGHSKLSCAELDVIFPIMMKRFAQSNCLGEYQYKYVDPGNEYLLVSCREAVQLIDFFNEEENKTAFHELLKLHI